MNETKEKRIVALDCIRFFAKLCVVLTHVTMYIVFLMSYMHMNVMKKNIK